MKCHFGKHKGTELSEIPSGYLRWAVNNVNARPSPEYQKHDDGTPMTEEEVNAAEKQMRSFLEAAEIELSEREENG